MNFEVIRKGKHFELLVIADGVYAAVANDGTGAVANAGVVDLGDCVLVFDSFNTQQAALELREAIHQVTGKPVGYLINSHWHGDHVRGNQVFRDVTILATEQTKRIMYEKHPARIAEQKAGMAKLRAYIQELVVQRESDVDEKRRAELAKQIAFLGEMETSLPTLELVLPNPTFASEWQTEGPRRLVECYSLGGGHTDSDCFLYIPDVKVCFVGDLVAVETHMAIADGNVAEWIAILDRLDYWDIDYVVPGHGTIGKSRWITMTQQYLQELLREYTVNGTMEANEIPSKYRDWAAPDVYYQNCKHLKSAK